MRGLSISRFFDLLLELSSITRVDNARQPSIERDRGDGKAKAKAVNLLIDGGRKKNLWAPSGRPAPDAPSSSATVGRRFSFISFDNHGGPRHIQYDWILFGSNIC